VYKDEANALIARSEYEKAMQRFEAASKLLPATSPEKADLLANKASCMNQLKR